MPPERAEATRVTSLELFFDLVFVFTVTQLTGVLADHPTPRGLLQVVLLLGIIWWMYDAYAWLTNAVTTDRATRRLLLLGGMAGFLVLALAVPRAFAGGGPAFGLAYLLVVVIHAGLFTRTSEGSAVSAILRLLPFNLGTALLVLLGGLIGGTARYLLWAVAFALEWVTPRLAGIGGFRIAPAHFVERHGLVIIVALGESVVAIGIGAAELPLDLKLAAVAVLGLLLSACLWWVYFTPGDDELAERALEAAPPEHRPRLAVDAFGYWHLVLLLAIVSAAAGVKYAVAHAFERVDIGYAVLLSAGVALFLAGHLGFQRTLGIGRRPLRAVAAGLALAVIPLGVLVSAVTQLGVLVAVLAGALAAEQAVGAERRPGTAL
jgi:low temperature requirement protein LtrA